MRNIRITSKQLHSNNKLSAPQSQASFNSSWTVEKSQNTTLDQSYDHKKRKSFYKVNRTNKCHIEKMESTELLQLFAEQDEFKQNNEHRFLSNINRIQRKRTEEDQYLKLKQILEKLLNLYIQQQIIKHHCSKTKWNLNLSQDKFNNILLPCLELLSIPKKQLKCLFQPFLNKISNKYLLYTHLDQYCCMSESMIVLSLTQVWIKIKQCQIQLKRYIRGCYTYFIRKFCVREEEGDAEKGYGIFMEEEQNKNKQKVILDRKNIYQFMFGNTQGNKNKKQRNSAREQLQMVNVIKIFILYYKINGENNEKSLKQWLQLY